jgi:hypothetical protein
MNHYLVVFDRSKGEVLRLQRYSDRDDALRARFTEEREHRGDPDIEVVVLGARSGESLRRTHGRYFKDFEQLAASARS